MHRLLILAFVFALAACDDPTGLGGDLQPTYTLSGIDGTLPAHVWDFVDYPVYAHSGTLEFWRDTANVARYRERLLIGVGTPPPDDARTWVNLSALTWANLGTYTINGDDLTLTPMGGGEPMHAEVVGDRIVFARYDMEYVWH